MGNIFRNKRQTFRNSRKGFYWLVDALGWEVDISVFSLFKEWFLYQHKKKLDVLSSFCRYKESLKLQLNGNHFGNRDTLVAWWVVVDCASRAFLS